MTGFRECCAWCSEGEPRAVVGRQRLCYGCARDAERAGQEVRWL